MASRQDVIDAVDQLSSQVKAYRRENERISTNQITILEGLSDLSDNVGLIRAGEFRTGRGIPGDSFSGVRIGYPGFDYGNDSYHIAGVNADTLQFGFRATDGVGVTAGGNVVLSNAGVLLTASGAAVSNINWVIDALAGIGAGRYGYIGVDIVGTTPARYGDMLIFADGESAEEGAHIKLWATGRDSGGPTLALDGRGTDPAITLNGDGADIDVVVKTNDVTDAFKMDAGLNIIQHGVGIEYEVETITGSSDTLDYTNYVALCDASSNAITINLPAVSGIAGRVFYIKKIDSTGNTVTVDGSSSETIDGATTAVLTTQYESITIQNNGTEWFIL